MTAPALKAEGLGKRYRLGGPRRLTNNFREALTETFAAPFRKLRHPHAAPPPEETVWALKDVSFEVRPGEVVGVIGRNGAGKTTLLKVLSRITEPTKGRAEIRGRVGSLLEIGTGFHPELTGRENVYLNGAVLGMRKKEIDRKFDEIVAFSEIERFMDTPVKRYSAGMHVRLAFAVAAHLEPEIMVVDEVLAVGDAAFQKKCLGKMGEAGRGGRTVLFVSHNLGAVRSLCPRALLLDGGRLVAEGETGSVLAKYVAETVAAGGGGQPGVFTVEESPEKHAFCVTKVEMLDRDGNPKTTLHTWDFVRFRIHLHAEKEHVNAGATLAFRTPDAVPVLCVNSRPLAGRSLAFRPGEQYVDCVFESFPLAEGTYVMEVGLVNPAGHWFTWLYRRDGLSLEVWSQDVFQSGVPPKAAYTLTAVPHRWETDRDG